MKFLINHYLARVIAVGFLSMLFCEIVLFSGRNLCDIGMLSVRVPSSFGHWSPDARNSLIIQPSGLINDLDKREDVVEPSQLYTYANGKSVSGAWSGVYEFDNYDFRRNRHKYLEYYCSKSHDGKKSERFVYFDKQLALYVSYLGRPGIGSENKWIEFYAYAGPNGIGIKPDKKLGRFGQPIGRELNNQFLIYDSLQMRFYRIDFKDNTVTKGEKMAGELSSIKPVQILELTGGQGLGRAIWTPPIVKLPQDKAGPNKTSRISEYMSEASFYHIDDWLYSDGHIAVLDDRGAIHKLDTERLEIVGSYGYLPSVYRNDDDQMSRPDELLDYSVGFFERNEVLQGIHVASLSRGGSILTQIIFDEHGRFVNEKQIDLFSAGMESPGGPLAITCRYILENLQAPALSIASYILRDRISPIAGRSGLFILPDSLECITRRSACDPYLWYAYSLLLLLFISPSIILSAILATLALLNGKKLGLTTTQRKAWFFAILLLGWTIYVTYLFVRPKGAMINCKNCGKTRRPEHYQCHHCQSDWHLPELSVPGWRIVDIAGDVQPQ